MTLHAKTKKPGRPRQTTGLALGTVLILIMMVALILMTMTNLSVASMRMTTNGREKAAALPLAEAGIDDTVDQLRLNSGYAGTALTPVRLYEDPPANSKQLGTFSAQVTPVLGSPNLRNVASTGLTKNGRSCQVRAQVSLSAFAVNGAGILSGAMVSNGDISIGGNAKVFTAPTDPVPHNADLIANGNISTGKSVDGTASAEGTVSGGGAWATVNGAPPISFPTPSTISAWQAQWIAAARAGGTMAGSAVSGTMTITGPKYINGDISGGQITFAGSGPIYVNGNVSLTANNSITNNTILVVSGTFQMHGQANYSAPLVTTPPILISLSTDLSSAILLRGGSSTNEQSVIYAVNGGINMAGNSTVNGALIAGGLGATITAQGNFNQYYSGKGLGDVDMGASLPTTATAVSWIEL